uniref:Uncharacterized protein n=1 Tax=Arion vulgaris TaxID=1028688 RepID=A0A0B7A911_9EUPU
MTVKHLNHFTIETPHQQGLSKVIPAILNTVFEAQGVICAVSVSSATISFFNLV